VGFPAEPAIEPPNLQIKYAPVDEPSERLMLVTPIPQVLKTAAEELGIHPPKAAFRSGFISPSLI
jgi:hypothetical protein